jgi:propanol-preferring alcohol dehydrogenase
MRAMELSRPGTPLAAVDRDPVEPGPGEIVVAVRACGVCRTDLHVVDGELPEARLPIVPGHEVVGRVVRRGDGADRFAVGARVGVPWLGWTCGSCRFCTHGRENLCPHARFTGYTRDGGYADEITVDERYAFALGTLAGDLDDAHAAPLLCAGLIGYRSLKLAGDAERLGLYGFGAAAHIVAQVARQQGRAVHAFVRPGDDSAKRFALDLGAAWAGDAGATPPVPLDAAIIYAPVGALVPQALRATAPGGVVVCAGIHMSEIPAFPYALLWEERTVRSVANLTRADGEEFLALAATMPIATSVTTYPLADANRALADLRDGRVSGAAVLEPTAV